MSGKRPTYSNLKNEISVFLVVFGLIILRYNRHETLIRSDALHQPVLILGVMHILIGVCLAVTSKKLFAVLGAILGTLYAVFYLVLEFSVLRSIPPANLLHLLVCVIPIILWIRVFALLKLQPVTEAVAQDACSEQGDESQAELRE